MALRRFRDKSPRVHPSCFVEDSAQVIGDVELGEDSSVWFNSVLRGDVNAIRIGQRTNIQDLTMVHVTSNRFTTSIGDDVTVGHHVVLHGCKVGNRVLVGMGAIVMDGAVVEDEVIIAAGAVVTPGKHLESGHVYAGNPAKALRPLKNKERAFFPYTAGNYVKLKDECLTAAAE